MMLSSADLKKHLRYDPDTGHFYWIGNHANSKCRSGDKAGSRMKSGYWRISVNGKGYTAHRLAWLYMTGEWPPLRMDHANGDCLDNRWCNLRLATASQNLANSRARSQSGFRGVLQMPNGMYRAAARLGGRYFYLGLFASAEEASAAYMAKAREIHGQFARAR